MVRLSFLTERDDLPLPSQPAFPRPSPPGRPVLVTLKRRRFRPAEWFGFNPEISVKRRRMAGGLCPLHRTCRLDEMGGICGLNRRVTGCGKLQQHLLPFPPRLVDCHKVIWVSYAPEASLWGRERPSFVHVFNLLFQSLELRLTHAGCPFDHGPLHFLS